MGIFRGWWIVAAASLGLSTSPGQFAFGSLGLFILPLGREFGWNRAEISLALTLFTLALAVSLPLIGRLVDRFGARWVLLPSMLVMGACFCAIPVVLAQLWHLYFIFVLIGSLGAGANNLPYLRVIAAWFDRSRGLAMGVAMAGSGLGYAYVPPLVQHLIDNWGWRAGYFSLAAITVVIAFPVVALFLVNAPADVGLAPDGGDRGTADAAHPRGFETSGAQALRSPVFWQLFAVFAAISFSLFGMMPHLVPMLTDRGMTGAEAALAFTTVGITITVSRALIGFLIDRVFAPHVALGCFLLSAVGLGLLAAGVPDRLVFVAAVCAGLSIGAELDLLAFLATRYFGLRAFGEIYGILFASLLLGTALGPLCYGLVFEATGSYLWILVTAAGLCTFAAAVTASMPRYSTFVRSHDVR